MAVMWSVIFYTVAAVAAFYFILLRPVLSQQKAQRQAVRGLHTAPCRRPERPDGAGGAIDRIRRGDYREKRGRPDPPRFRQRREPPPGG